MIHQVIDIDYDSVTLDLLDLPESKAQQQMSDAYRSGLDADQLASALKQQSDRFLGENIDQARAAAALLLHLAGITCQPLHRALGLRAMGNVLGIGLGQHQQAIACYDEAATIYRSLGYGVDEAKAQVGKIWVLTCLGRNDEALQTGTWASGVLEAHGQWLQLADLKLNLASVWSRQGDDQHALALLDQAAALYRQLDEVGRAVVPLVENNRAISLRNLGRFTESIQASMMAERLLSEELAQPIEAARTRQNLAMTYVVLGRLNEALKLREHARTTFLNDGRMHDAMLVELEISTGLLHMRRFADVLEMCHLARTLFSDQKMRLEVAHAFINEAIASAGLQRYREALDTLTEARHLFADEHSPYWVAVIDLETAVILYHQGEFGSSLTVAQVCAVVFQDIGMPVKEAQARLVAAWSAAGLQQRDVAAECAKTALGLAHDIPSLSYQAHHLLGVLAHESDRTDQAAYEYDQAIQILEQLRASLMVEFRIDFLEDKQAVYENVVRLYMDDNQPQQALEYAERARSQALLDLLAYRLDLSIRPRAPADEALVQQIEQLRAERDRWYRRWQGSMEMVQTDHQEERQQAEHMLIDLEKQITNRWHTLLVRNADYARDASLWQVRTEPVQPYLDQQTLLIEYFICNHEVVVFLVTRDDVRMQRLTVELPQLQQTMQSFQHHLKSVPRVSQRTQESMIRKAHRALQRLYQFLIAPFADILSHYPRLVIVPHQTLHYLPFHAFSSGEQFLIEQHEVSYLPVASLMRYQAETRPTTSRHLVAFGHSYGQRLPYAVQEAADIAQRWDGVALLEDNATLKQVHTSARDCGILHFSTHGDFRLHNPLFSGLSLADGQLTTLDIFNLKLKTSLVTLSACQTGLSVIGGGDELLGLTRAFLYAGAASLVLSLWKVADRSTLQLMETFYGKLAEGATKGAALRAAQLQLLQHEDEPFTHPYFWAPFFLIGDTGPLVWS